MRRGIGLILVLAMLGCSSSPQPEASRQAAAINAANALGASPQSLPVGEFNLQYVESGEIGNPTVVLIHGTPGSWRSLSRLFDHEALTRSTRLVSVDRPGWGGSPLLDKKAEGSFAEQARLMEPLLRQLKAEAGDQPLILVGHSLGASMAPYIAYRYPELVDGLLMASGAIDPQLGKPRWYNHAASIWPLSALIDERLAKANVEIWGVYEALSELEPWWQDATIPMIYLQGENDELVDPRNLDFAENFLPAEHTKVVRLPNQGHFVHRQRSEEIAELALELIDQVNRQWTQLTAD